MNKSEKENSDFQQNKKIYCEFCLPSQNKTFSKFYHDCEEKSSFFNKVNQTQTLISHQSSTKNKFLRDNVLSDFYDGRRNNANVKLEDQINEEEKSEKDQMQKLVKVYICHKCVTFLRKAKENMGRKKILDETGREPSSNAVSNFEAQKNEGYLELQKKQQGKFVQFSRKESQEQSRQLSRIIKEGEKLLKDKNHSYKTENTEEFNLNSPRLLGIDSFDKKIIPNQAKVDNENVLPIDSLSDIEYDEPENKEKDKKKIIIDGFPEKKNSSKNLRKSVHIFVENEKIPIQSKLQKLLACEICSYEFDQATCFNIYLPQNKKISVCRLCYTEKEKVAIQRKKKQVEIERSLKARSEKVARMRTKFTSESKQQISLQKKRQRQMVSRERLSEKSLLRKCSSCKKISITVRKTAKLDVCIKCYDGIKQIN